MILASSKRSGFTLLEVLLASAIAVLLLGALYVAFDVTLRTAEIGRETVDHSNLMRGITSLLSRDLGACIGPMQPKSGGGVPPDPTTTSSSSSSSSTTGTTSSSSSSTTTTGTTTSSTTTTATTSSLNLTAGTASAALVFQAGLQGTSNQLTLYTSVVPPALVTPETADPQRNGNIDTRPDLRRVIYYIGSNGGLCRQERPWVTASTVLGITDPDTGCEDQDMIAEEVTSVTFSYFGTDPTGNQAWVDTWDGTQTAIDGASVLGPPRAIKVTMVIQPAGSTDSKTISHVIAIRSAVGLYVPTTESGAVDPADPTTTTSGM